MQIVHHFFDSITSSEEIVEVTETEAFNEFILSWNGLRPAKGYWSFSVSLFQQPWLLVAEWGIDRQKTFSLEDSFTKVYQDVVSVKKPCTDYKIRIRAEEGASLKTLRSITLSTGVPQGVLRPKKYSELPSVHLKGILPQSQQILPHARATHLCSPTSTAAAINFLVKKRAVDPVIFASQVRDQTFDIYGNWILNTAAAYEVLQGDYQTFVARLPDFAALHAQLTQNLPVVVSIKGPLPGAPLPYANGHLVLIIGYEAGRIFCMDPAFPTNEKTITSYLLEDFLTAWTDRRKNLSYLFRRSSEAHHSPVESC